MNEESYSSSTTPGDTANMESNIESSFLGEKSGALLEELGINIDDPFNPAIIEHLPELSVEQLSKLENQISQEFAELSRNYIDARKSRVSSLLKNLDVQIKKFQDNDAEWTDIYFNQLSALEDYTAHPEDAQKGSEKFEAFLDTIKLPWELDDLFKTRKLQLPFADYVQRIIQPHQQELVAFNNLKNYLTTLVDQLLEKNRVILWKQYHADVVEYKEKLIQQTYEELSQLHKEYYGVNSNEEYNLRNKFYYRSVVPMPMTDSAEYPQARLSSQNIDTYYDIDNVYCKKNKIEITSTKYETLGKLTNFNKEQHLYAIPQIQEANVILAGCMGLNEEDIDADMLLLRGNNYKKRKGADNSKVCIAEIQSEGKPSDRQLLYKDVLDMNRKKSEIEIQPYGENPVTAVPLPN